MWNRGERPIRMYWNEPGTSRTARRYLNVPANSLREYTTVVRVKSRLAPWIRIQAERVKHNGRSYIPLIDGYKSVDAIRLTRVKKTNYLFVEHSRKIFILHLFLYIFVWCLVFCLVTDRLPFS